MSPSIVDQGLSYIGNVANSLKLELTRDAIKRLKDYVNGLEGAPALLRFPSWTTEGHPEKTVDTALILTTVGLNSLLIALRDKRKSVSSTDVTTALRGIGEIQPVLIDYAAGIHWKLTDRCDKVASKILQTIKVGANQPSEGRAVAGVT